MATGPRNQYAHMAKLAVDFVRKRPNRACPRAPPSRLLPHRAPPSALRDPFPARASPVSRAAQSTSSRRCSRTTAWDPSSRAFRWEERGAPDSFWTVTKLKPKASGRAGKAWGTLTWRGRGEGRRAAHPQGDDQGDLESDRGRDATGRTGSSPSRPSRRRRVREDVDAAMKMRAVTSERRRARVGDVDDGATERKATRKGVA